MKRNAVGVVLVSILSIANVVNGGTGGTVTMTAQGSTSVMAGDDILFDLYLTSEAAFDFADIIIGLSPATGANIAFESYDPAWENAFASGSYSWADDVTTLPSHDENILLHAQTAGGTVGPELAVGTLRIQTAGMLPADYTVSVSDDSYTFYSGEGGTEYDLTGALDFTIVPEPAAAVLLIGGVVLLRRRR